MRVQGVCGGVVISRLTGLDPQKPKPKFGFRPPPHPWPGRKPFLAFLGTPMPREVSI